MENTERQALDNFRRKMQDVETELRAIDSELSRRDLLALTHRSHAAVRHTRDLLDKNVDILFAGQPSRFHEDLYEYLGYADEHIGRALREETEDQAIERRLSLATRLAEDVLSHIAGALSEIERRLEPRGQR